VSKNAKEATIVLVHGAWADGCSWSEVIRPLQEQGYKVIAAPIPLTSLSDDVRAVNRVIKRTSGPVVLAAHAYAGAVISGCDDSRVKSLVYIAALTPAEGETVADVFYRDAKHDLSPKLAPDADGLIWMPDEGFGNAFSHHASAAQVKLFMATQRPIAVPCIQERAPRPAWLQKPAWCLIAEEDRMIAAVTQHFMADRMKARKRAEKLDHTPMATAPHRVVDIIVEAAA
jgi:pimeloyl-ACP methyl ester carboxylesterase